MNSEEEGGQEAGSQGGGEGPRCGRQVTFTPQSSMIFLVTGALQVSDQWGQDLLPRVSAVPQVPPLGDAPWSLLNLKLLTMFGPVSSSQ